MEPDIPNNQPIPHIKTKRFHYVISKRQSQFGRYFSNIHPTLINDSV
jgi:hypothetical protein